MAQQAQVVAQEDARVGMQGTGTGKPQMLRTRIPTSILLAMGAQDGEYLRWTLYDNGELVGFLINAADAKPNDITTKQAAKAPKKAAPRASKKPAARKPKMALDAFDTEEVEEAPARRPIARRPAQASTTRPAPRSSVPAAVRRPAPAPAPAPAPGRHPRAAGPIAKPGVTRRAKRAGLQYNRGE